MQENITIVIKIKNKLYNNLKVKEYKNTKKITVKKKHYNYINTNIKKILISFSDTLKFEITKLLHEIGFSETNDGFELYKKSLYYIISENITKCKRFMTNLYTKLAIEFNKNVKTIEKNMRYSLNRAWNKQNLNKLEQLLGYSFLCQNENPTNYSLILALTEILKRKLSFL